jgi:hypothetical protein
MGCPGGAAGSGENQENGCPSGGELGSRPPIGAVGSGEGASSEVGGQIAGGRAKELVTRSLDR